jgi:hypothetical protein
LLKWPGAIVSSSFLELATTSRVRWLLLNRGAMTSMDCRILLLLRLKTTIIRLLLLLNLRILLLMLIILLMRWCTLHHSVVLLGFIVATWIPTMILFIVEILILASLLRNKVCIDVDTNVDIIRLIYSSRSLILWLVRIIVIAHSISLSIHIVISRCFFIFFCGLSLNSDIWLGRNFFLLFISYLIWRCNCSFRFLSFPSATSIFSSFFTFFSTILISFAYSLNWPIFWSKLWILLNKSIINFNSKLIRMA